MAAPLRIPQLYVLYNRVTLLRHFWFFRLRKYLPFPLCFFSSFTKPLSRPSGLLPLHPCPFVLVFFLNKFSFLVAFVGFYNSCFIVMPHRYVFVCVFFVLFLFLFLAVCPALFGVLLGSLPVVICW
jgi:hypothetical protein